MTSAPVSGTPPRDLSPLSVLGFSVRQERFYRLVLRNSGATLSELRDAAMMPSDELREQLGHFVGAGLLEIHGDRVLARPPEEALGRLVNDEARRVVSRGEQLDAVRDLLPSLVADHLAATAPHGERVDVEVLAGGDVSALMRSLSAASTGDLLWLRPDPWNAAPGNAIDDWVVDLVRAGRRSRAIYDVDVLSRAPDMIRRRVEAGESVRILATVPTRLAVLGGSAALIAEELGMRSDRRLVLRHQSMVAALTLMFEGLWEKAVPIPGMGGQRDLSGSGDQRMLLNQLAVGAKDEQIARTLGLSVRTVRRRVADLLAELGAVSRFEAGVEAVRRGWV